MPRVRENSLHIRLSDQELALLKRKSQKAGINPQAYIIALIKGNNIKEQPSVEWQELLKALRQINNNMNQIAVKANSNGFIDTVEYWKNVKQIQEITGRIMEAIY